MAFRIPRYTAGRSNISELDAQVRASISPEEAARTAAASYNALTSVSGSVNEVLDTMDKVAAKEELASSVSQFEAAMAAVDGAFAAKPQKLDEFGNPIDDTQETLAEQRAARQKLINDVSANMSNPLAQQAFDKYSAEESVTRDAEGVAQALERRTEILETRALKDIQDLSSVGLYDAAIQRARGAYSNNALSPAKYVEEVHGVGLLKDSDYVMSVALNPTTDSLFRALVQVKKGELPDGTPMTSGIKAREAYADMLQTELDQFDTKVGKALKLHQDQKFFDALLPSMTGKVSMEQLVQMGRDGNLSKEGVTLLVGKRASGRVDDPDEKRFYETALMGLRVLPIEDYAQQKNQLEFAIFQSPLLSTETKNAMLTGIQSDNQIVGNELYQLLKSKVYSSINGFEESKLSSMVGSLSSHYRETTQVAKDWQIALFQEFDSVGPQRYDEMIKWVDDNEQGYRLRANSKVLINVGVTVPFPTEGDITEDMKNEMTNQMQRYINEQNALGGQYSAAAILAVQTAVRDIEHLTGVSLRDPTAQAVR